jgi:hypothetical protein
VEGAGKTALAVGLVGCRVSYDSQTKDYRAADTYIAEKFRVSNDRVSETRKPNIKLIKNEFTKDKPILIIDMPGFR